MRRIHHNTKETKLRRVRARKSVCRTSSQQKKNICYFQLNNINVQYIRVGCAFEAAKQVQICSLISNPCAYCRCRFVFDSAQRQIEVQIHPKLPFKFCVLRGTFIDVDIQLKWIYAENFTLLSECLSLVKCNPRLSCSGIISNILANKYPST